MSYFLSFAMVNHIHSGQGNPSNESHSTGTGVIGAALIAFGRFGHRPVKKVLESCLQTAIIDQISEIVDALVPTSDEETAISFGCMVEPISGENIRYVVVEALTDLDGGAAMTWWFRLVDDSYPAIRQVVPRHMPFVMPLARWLRFGV